MPRAPDDLATFEANATMVATMLRALANERRLMVLCKLVEWGEGSVGALAEAIGLSQSATSQHLAKMRDEKLAHEVFQKADWIFDFDKARAEAKKSDQLIFAYFTRSYAN